MSDDTLERGKKIAAEIGLKIASYKERYPGDDDVVHYYKADDIHKLLGRGIETFTRNLTQSNFNTRRLPDDDLVALQIALRPIKQPDTAESLLKELAYCSLREDFYAILDRAKVYLTGGEK